MNMGDIKLKKINLLSTVFFILIAVFYLAHEKSTLSKQNTNDNFVPVISVSDGDTIVVLIDGKKEKVRFIGIDAPELAQKPWGEEAKKYLEALLGSSGWRLRLEFDIEKRDKYGRLLAYLWTTKNQMLNFLIIKSGYAMLYTIPPNVKYAGELRAAQNEARSKRLGIWSGKGLSESPRDYRKEHPRR
jgi:micrococcal nuclease